MRLFLVLVFFASAAKAQPASESPRQRIETPSTDRIWFGGGLGVASGGTGVAGHWTYVTGRHVFSLRSAISFDPFGELFSALSEWDLSRSAFDFGLLYGRPLVDTPQGFVSVGAGIGGVQRTQEGAPLVLGLPLEVQATIRLSSWFGLGVYGFGNLNGEQSFGGFTLGVQVGQVW